MRAPHIIRILALALAAAVVVGAFAGCGPSGVASDASGGNDGPGTPDAEVPADAFGGPDFGQPCVTSEDCDGGGYCIDSISGRVCTYACDAGCPFGFDCRVAEVDGTLVSVCVPVVADLCTSCTSDATCAGGACVTLDGMGFCLANCPFEGECQSGYTCGPDPTGEHAGVFCVPDTGSCTCDASNDGAIRTCENTNPVGTCHGLEMCVAGTGWIGCNAPAAVAEVCDGADNDCDSLIDDGVAGGMACTIDVTGVGSCPGVTLCTGSGGVVCQGPTPELETCNYTDDDCDTNVDETFPGLAAVCDVGIGACQRFGVVQCTASGTGTACSATAGMPIAELCNTVDDDCDTDVDEAFPSLGGLCTVGAGICTRVGNNICTASGSGVTCSVTPGPADPSETCNTLDDDCDSVVDEGFRNPVTGQYDQDIACGSCAVDCTVLYDLDNASGQCVATGTPTCAMVCDGGTFDLDGAVGNGCEFVLDTGAIYVSTSDPASADDAGCGLGPVGTGPGHHPCETINQGLARANALGRARVLVANGIYTESVTLVNNRSLLGGYQWDTWARDAAGTSTQISGVSSTGNHDRTVIASNITTPVTFEGFVVRGAVNGKTGGNSYAIYVSGSSGSLSIVNNLVIAGRGGPGADGSGGSDGLTGVAGAGAAGNPVAYDAHQTTGAAPCAAGSNNRQYGNGGARVCGGDDVSGGQGGGNQCAPRPSASLVELSALDGASGQAGAGVGGGAAGTGADAGDDMYLDNNPPALPAGLYCFLPTSPAYGADGLDGVNGGHGSAVSGCSVAIGAVVGGHWTGGSAGTGISAWNGGGGGGGGAGGGGNCTDCAAGRDEIGAHGGGGGSGGCGGAGGGGAQPGGGAFGIFVAGGLAPAVSGNTIIAGEGGSGGTGGHGGTGGAGGIGASGGTSVRFCAEKAGRGGNGGDGGHGSGGGGGCGGASFGIHTSGIGTPAYCGATNVVVSGVGGAGGAGGYSLIAPGGNGTSGTAGTCSFN
jgi:hypothetical protein